MPRQARIDIPGVFQHVMARGIDGMKIYRSPKDCRVFLQILSDCILSSDGCTVVAWALMPNHFHLLIFINKKPLSHIMRKLLTKYALYFNKKYKRRGHLYQNRYKSIVCDEDLYLRQLVRYIHLNPYKAKIVKTLQSLDSYEFTGHKTLLGKVDYPWQDTQFILKMFEGSPKEYRLFIKSEMSNQVNLDGGGLKKSILATGESIESFIASNNENRQMYDDRILGGGDFVEQILTEVESKGTHYVDREPLNEIIKKILLKFGVDKSIFKKRSEPAMKIKRLIVETCVIKHLYTAAEVADELGMNRSTISRMVSKQEIVR